MGNTYGTVTVVNKTNSVFQVAATPSSNVSSGAPVPTTTTMSISAGNTNWFTLDSSVKYDITATSGKSSAKLLALDVSSNSTLNIQISSTGVLSLTQTNK